MSEPETTAQAPPPAFNPDAIKAPAAPSAPKGTAFQSYTPGLVAVTKPDGEVSQIRTEDAPAALSQGFRPATEGEYYGALHPTGAPIMASVAGGLRGLSYGTSDALATAGSDLLTGDPGGGDMRRTLNLLKQANPGISMGSEIAGAVAPAFFGAPEGLADAGANASGALARFGARALAAAPHAAMEGAAIGIGNQFSEDTLANRPLAAEAYLSAGVKGGALGVLLGGAGAGAFGAAGDKLGQYFGRGGADAAETLGERVGVAEEKDVAPVAEGFFSKRLNQEGDISTFKGATGAKTADLKRLGIDVEDIEGREAELGQMLREQKLTGPLTSQAETGRRLTEKVNEIGKSFRPLYESLDAAETGVKPSMNSILQAFDEKVRAPRLDKIGGADDLKPANEFLQEMMNRDGEQPSFSKLWSRRQELDAKLAKNYTRVPGMPNPPGEDDLRALKNIINQEIDTAASRADPALAERLRTSNQLYSDLKTVHKINTSNVVRDAMSNNKISLSDVVLASHGGLPGIAAAGLNMVKRRFSDQLAGHVLNSASQMDVVQRAAAKLDDLLSNGTRRFVKGEKGAERAIKPVTSAEVRAIREATRTPEIVQAKTAEHLGTLPQTAPKLAQNISTTIARAAAWAQRSLPKEQPPVGPIFNQPKPRQLSDSQLVKARATLETIEDGSIVVDRLIQGRLTPEHVATLKYVHPETYAQIQQYLGTHATELKQKLTTQQEFQLGMLFGTPINEASLPENVRAFQATFSQGNQAPSMKSVNPMQGLGAPKMGRGAVNVGGSRAMAQDRLEAGGK